MPPAELFTDLCEKIHGLIQFERQINLFLYNARMGLVLRQEQRHPGQEFTILSLYNQHIIVFDNTVFLTQLFSLPFAIIEISNEERKLLSRALKKT